MMDNETSSKLLEFTLQFIQAGCASLSQFKIEGDCKTTTIILQFQNASETPMTAPSLDSLQSGSDQMSNHGKETYSNEVPAESLRSNRNATNSTNSTNMCFEVNGSNKDMVIEQLSQLMKKYNREAASEVTPTSGQPSNNQSSQSQAEYVCRDLKENNMNKANQLRGVEENRNNESGVRNANALGVSYEASDALDIEKVMNEILIERSFQQMCQEPCFDTASRDNSGQKECKFLAVPLCQNPGQNMDRSPRNRGQSDGWYEGDQHCLRGAKTYQHQWKSMDASLYTNTEQARSDSDETDCKYIAVPQAMSVPSSPTLSVSGAHCYSIPEEPEVVIYQRRRSDREGKGRAQFSGKCPLPVAPKKAAKPVRMNSQSGKQSRLRQRSRDSDQSICDSDTGSARSDTASVRTDEDYDTMDTHSSRSSRSSVSSSKSPSCSPKPRLPANSRRKAYVSTRGSQSLAIPSMVTSFSSSIGTMSNPGDDTGVDAGNDEDEDDDDDDKDSDAGGDDFELLSDLSKHQKQEKKQFRKQKSIFGI